MSLADQIRHGVEHSLAESGLHPTESAMLTVSMALAAVELAEEENAIPGLAVEVTNRLNVERYLTELAIKSNPRRSDVRPARAEHKRKWGEACPFLTGAGGEVLSAGPEGNWRPIYRRNQKEVAS